MGNVEPGELVGRAQEAAELERLVGRVAGGQGQAVVVRGEPGIGKTRLVRTALAACERRGFEAYVAAASEMEMRRPFGVIADALQLRGAADDMRSEIRQMLRRPADEAARGQAGEGVEFQLAERVVEYLEARAANAPVVLVAEDLHWADPASLMALGWLAREGAQLPVLLVCTLSPYPARPDVGSLLASFEKLGVGRLQLGPLSPAEVEELVGHLAGAPPGEGLLRLLGGANGNPFYVRELVAALRADGTLSVGPGGRVEVAQGQLPVSLRHTVLHGLGRLPAPTLDVLRTAAVLGESFSTGELQAVLSRPVAELIGTLRPAIQAEVLTGIEEGLAFRHRLVREAVYEDIPRPLRRAQHREVAATLAAAKMPGERVAAHLVLGADRGDREAAGWLRGAARDTAARAPAIACELLERARDLYLPDDPARAEVLAEMVQPLAWASRHKELQALCRRALEGEGRPEDEMMFWMGLGLSLMGQGRFRQARSAFEQMMASSGLGEPERVTGEAHAALCGVYLGDLAAAERISHATSGRWGPMAAGIARLAAATAELNAGRPEHALAMFDALAATGPPDRWSLQVTRGAALLDLDEVEKARAVLREWARHSLLNGTPGRTAIHHYVLVAVEYAAGELDAALAEHEAGLALAEGSEERWWDLSFGLAAAVMVHRGELDRAAELVKQAEEDLAADGPSPRDDEAARARYLLARSRGDPEGAALAAGEAWGRCADHGYRPHLTWFGVDLVRASLEVGDLQRAREAAEAAEEVAKGIPVACWEACAAWAQGLVTGDAGGLLEAVRRMRASPRRLYLALCLEDAALALARAGKAGDARPLAVEALDLFAVMDAVTDASRLSAGLRAAGIHLGSRARRGRPRHGWDSLSTSELNVVRLVAEGKTNREVADRLFVSRDTVHTHVSNALRKLGLSSRVELAAEAVRRGL